MAISAEGFFVKRFWSFDKKSIEGRTYSCTSGAKGDTAPVDAPGRCIRMLASDWNGSYFYTTLSYLLFWSATH